MLTEYERNLFGEPYADIEGRLRTDTSLSRALDTLTERYGDERLAVTDLARAAGLSATVLRDRFRRLAGITPRRFILRYRKNKSLRMLYLRQNSVSEIAQRVGFSNVSGLEKCFRSAFGESPGAIRRSLKADSTKETPPIPRKSVDLE